MKKPPIIAATLVTLVLGGGVTWASIPHSTTGTITGCYSKNTGALRVVDKQAGKKCRSYERELPWQQAGAQGPQGPQGPAGPSGDGAGAFRVRDAAGNDLGALVSGPDHHPSPIPGDAAEFDSSRAVVVRRDDGTFAAYDVGNGGVPEHGDLVYFTGNCTGAPYIRLADLTTFTTFYGIPPVEVDNGGDPVRGLTVSGSAVIPTEANPLESVRSLGDGVCADYSSFPLWGVEHTVKLAATAAYLPAGVTGPLVIVSP